MKILLDRGADVKAKNRDGKGVVYLPATANNWKVLLLLQRGAPWRDQRGVGGMPFRNYVEGEARLGTGGGLAEVLEFFKNANVSGVP